MPAVTLVFNYEKNKVDKFKKIAKEDLRTVSSLMKLIFSEYLQAKEPVKKRKTKTKIKMRKGV